MAGTATMVDSHARMKPASRHIVHFVAFLSVFLLSSCGKPVGGSNFIAASSLSDSDGGWYCFTADLEEGRVYFTSIAMRLNTHKIQKESIAVEIYLVSPTGDSAIEVVDLPLSDNNSAVSVLRNKGSVADYRWLYRRNVMVSGDDAGIWNIRVRPYPENVTGAVEGVGFSYELENGKR